MKKYLIECEECEAKYMVYPFETDFENNITGIDAILPENCCYCNSLINPVDISDAEEEL
jgi:hypothetical protein